VPEPTSTARAAGDQARARLALVAVTTVWGSTFVVVHSALDSISPFVLVTTRFALAAATLLALRAAPVAAAARATAEALPLALAMLAGFALQTIGLQSTTPARSAFVTALSVLLVPLLELGRDRRPPRRPLLLAVALAGLGIWLLFRPVGLEWRRGDTWTAGGALAFAYCVVELGRISRRHAATALVVAQSWLVAAFALPLALLAERPRLELGPGSLAALLYLSVVCTALNFVWMTWAQARVSPTEAAVIYALEPVFAATFSTALGREAAVGRLLTGGGFIVVAVLLSGLPALPASRGRDRH
jgi:drug/metabolite transporter (DMT)-like permease